VIKIVKFVTLDIIKNKIVLLYTILLSVFSWSSFSLEDSNTKGILTLLSIVLLTVPLVSVLFSTIYIYRSFEFIELLVSQPIKRSKIWVSLFLGLSFSFVSAFLIGTGLPLLYYSPNEVGYIMIAIGCIISVIFVAIAFLSAIITRDKAKGIGVSILLWLYFALLFDGVVLFLLFQFADYPIEKPMVAILSTNPIDLARILIILKLDASAMLGYTGAIFKDFFGSSLGVILSFLLLILWVIIPFYLSLIKFKNKDL
jgi:Cu-processing system permease protein